MHQLMHKLDLTPGMSPKHIEDKRRIIPALLLEEFAQPSIRRHSDGYEDQETEIHGRRPAEPRRRMFSLLGEEEVGHARSVGAIVS